MLLLPGCGIWLLATNSPACSPPSRRSDRTGSQTMHRTIRTLPLLFGFAVLTLSLCHLFAQGDRDDRRLPPRPLTRQECDKLAGLPLEEVRQQLGPPRTINRQILNHRYLEQW